MHAVFVEPRPRPLKQLLRACARYGGFPEATAVFGSSNSRLSAVKHLVERAKWSCAFRNMFYEALDIALPNVSVAPLGLDEMFIASAGEEHVRRTILGATFAAKTQAVLVANGYFWDVPRARRYREDFTEFLRKACWLASLSLEPARYWEELARARFLIVPGGQGVQASKVVEALLVLTSSGTNSKFVTPKFVTSTNQLHFSRIFCRAGSIEVSSCSALSSAGIQ